MNIAVFVLAAALLLVTLLPLSRNPVWWVRAWDFPRLQLAALLVVTIALEVAFPIGSWALTGAVIATLLACLAWQAWWIFPYTPFARMDVPLAVVPAGDDSNRLRLLNANVQMENRNADALIALVREHEPDVFVTLESNQWWQDRLDCLAEAYPHSCKCPLDNRYGMHVYSRLPMSDVEQRFMVDDDCPSIHLTLTLRSGRTVQAHFTHPKPPSPTESDTSKSRDVELILIGREMAKEDGPVVVAGDLNDVAWSRTTREFRHTSGLLDPRCGRGMFNTFHARLPFLRAPLDHVFHSAHFSLVSIRRLPAIGSDHFPILVELHLDQ